MHIVCAADLERCLDECMNEKGYHAKAFMANTTSFVEVKGNKHECGERPTAHKRRKIGDQGALSLADMKSFFS